MYCRTYWSTWSTWSAGTYGRFPRVLRIEAKANARYCTCTYKIIYGAIDVCVCVARPTRAHAHYILYASIVHLYRLTHLHLYTRIDRRIYCLSRRQLHCGCCRCLSSYPPRLGSRQLPSSVAQDSLAAAFADLLLRTVLAAKCYQFPATAESLNGRTGKPGHPR